MISFDKFEIHNLPKSITIQNRPDVCLAINGGHCISARHISESPQLRYFSEKTSIHH